MGWGERGPEHAGTAVALPLLPVHAWRMFDDRSEPEAQVASFAVEDEAADQP
jgi:hypothetical protein